MSNGNGSELALSEQKWREALELINQARRSRSNGNTVTPREVAQEEMRKVMTVIDESLQHCPQNHRARFLKVSCAMKIEDFNMARIESKKIYEGLTTAQLEKMDNSMLHLSIVHASKNSGHTEDALHFSQEAVRLFPKDPQPYMVLAELFSGMQRVQDAEYMYRQSLLHNDDPACTQSLSNQNVYFNLCSLADNLKQQKKYSEAELFLIRALRLDKKSPLAYKRLAEVYHCQGHPSEALQMARKAEAIDPKDEKVQNLIQKLSKQLQEGTSAYTAAAVTLPPEIQEQTVAPSSRVADENDDVGVHSSLRSGDLPVGPMKPSPINPGSTSPRSDCDDTKIETRKGAGSKKTADDENENTSNDFLSCCCDGKK